MTDIIHALLCVFSAARYLNIAPAVMGLYQKVSGTAPLLAALNGGFRLFSFFLLTKTPRFHDFTFSRFHDFGVDENTTISRFHIINLPKRCYRPLSRPRWQSPNGGSSSGKGGETFQPAVLES